MMVVGILSMSMTLVGGLDWKEQERKERGDWFIVFAREQRL